MSHRRAYAFSTLAVVTVLALPADGQSVISTRSGTVYYFEGAVYLGDQPLEPHFGRFTSMAEGAELRTAQGRAEVLLTPGVFLRLGESTAIRLVVSDLSDTRVELLAGKAVVESAEPSPGTSVTLVYKDWKVRFLQRGLYRIDSEPPRLSVHEGDAEVSGGTAGAPVSVKHGMELPFAAVLVPERSIDLPGDALADWARGRSESISADNAITAQIDEDPASRDPGLAADSIAYFPFLGVTPLGSGLYSGYGSYNSYQPGFSSIYLPGYSYRPLLLGLGPSGLRGYVYSSPRRVGSYPIVPAPHVPLPAPGHTAPHGAVHVGGHR